MKSYHNKPLLVAEIDPFVVCKLREGTDKLKTDVIKKNLNPKWSKGTATFEILIWDKDIEELVLSVLDKDVVTYDELIGTCSIKLKDLDQNKLERHERELKLSDYGAKDTKVKRPVLRVSTQYFSCPDEEDAEKIADALTKEDPETAAVAIADAARELSAMEDIAILHVQGLELKGVQSISGPNMINEKIHLKLSVGNEEKSTKNKRNKAQPFSVLWLESVYFIVKHPSTRTLRISIMHKAQFIAGGVDKTFGALTGGHIEAKTKELGYFEVDLADVLQSSGRCFDLSKATLTSEKINGELAGSVIVNMNRKVAK